MSAASYSRANTFLLAHKRLVSVVDRTFIALAECCDVPGDVRLGVRGGVNRRPFSSREELAIS
jgi:hypothetical protein